MSDRLAACVVDPGRVELLSTYDVNAQYGIPVYGAIQYAAEQDPELLPPGYAEVFSNLSNILDPLLLQCNATSGAPEAFAAPLLAQMTGAPIYLHLSDLHSLSEQPCVKCAMLVFRRGRYYPHFLCPSTHIRLLLL